MNPPSTAAEAQYAPEMAMHSDLRPSESAEPVDFTPHGGQPPRDDDDVNDNNEERQGDAGGSEDAEDSDEETERHFKYAKLTGHLSSVYRNGDSVSASLVSGDKLIIGTHGGNVHVFSIPSLRTLRTYHAHDASITSISVAPYSQIFSHDSRTASDKQEEKQKPLPKPASGSTKGLKYVVPPTPSNLIYIGTASLDGWAVVSSLADPKDVTLRNFKRPLRAISLSPEFKYDRSYLSGGMAGELILTTGGPSGVKAEANTNSTAATASGWLGQMGLGAKNGKDSIKAYGEGAISAISWSLSGKYVAWVNEEGIKIARSHCFLQPDIASFAWTKIGHIAKPTRKSWDGMAAVWRGKIQWVDHKNLDTFEDHHEVSELSPSEEGPQTPTRSIASPRKQNKKPMEQLLVGWGDAVWVFNVDPKGQHLKKPGQSPALGVPIPVHRLVLDEGIIAGIALFTPTAFLALTYPTKQAKHTSRVKRDSDTPSESASRRGIRKTKNGLKVEMRLISLDPGTVNEEIDFEILQVKDFESFSAVDYQMSTLFFARPPKTASRQRNALGQLSDGIWDASIGATTRLFSSGASVMSGSSDDKASVSTAQATIESGVGTSEAPIAFPPAYTKPGLKVFLMSPSDCFMGVKRDKSDHLNFLVETGRYQRAWTLLEKHPEVVGQDGLSDSRPPTPTPNNSTLVDFFDDVASQSADRSNSKHESNFAVRRERRRIGDLWVQQLVDQGDWAAAGDIVGKAIETPQRWEHWISVFSKADKFDEIVPHMPATRLRPAISSTLYELVLGHYLNNNPQKLKHLMSTWDASLYDTSTVTSAIESRIAAVDDKPALDATAGFNEPVWRLLQSCLADLLLLDGRIHEAVQSYIRAGDRDAAVQLVRDNQLYLAVADRVYAFVTVGITPQQMKAANHSNLDEQSKGSVHLLAAGTSQGLISVSTVIEQLKGRTPSADVFLYFYFRALFNGDIDKEVGDGQPRKAHVRRSRFAPLPSTNMTRVLLTSYADLAVTLFAEFDPPLLNTLIRTNDASADVDLSGGALRFTFEHASAVCKARGLTSELVYLLALTGQTREALHLIAEEMKDVARAIAFAREMDDKALWGDLLEFSLDKPPFIKGLLEEVGGGIGEQHDSETTAIDPLTLVQQIPERLEIEGLKEGLARILKDGEVQTSISEGAAKVLRSEVSMLIDRLTRARARGVVFDVVLDELQTEPDATERDSHLSNTLAQRERTCAICKCAHALPLTKLMANPGSQDYLIGLSCGHIVHLECVLERISTPSKEDRIEDLRGRLSAARNAIDEEDRLWLTGKVGPKVTRMRFIRDILGDFACTACDCAEEEDGTGGA